MKRKVLKLFKSSVAIAGTVSMLCMTPVCALSVSAAEQGVIKNHESITLEVGDTAILQGERAYGYSDYEIQWTTDNDGIISIESTDDGNSWDKYTTAEIKAVSAGTVTVNLKADYHGMWSYDESFTINVNGTASEEPSIDEPVVVEDNKNLFIRLVGNFEHKMVGEEDIDAVSSATTVSYVSTGANAVKLEAALVDKDVDRDSVPEDSWHPLSYFENSEDAVKINPDHSKTKIIVEPECPGVEVGYNVWDGTVAITGKPEQAGDYKISVQFTDTENRVAISNDVNFTVYELDGKLVDVLNYDNATQTSDGKYIYDQKPWYISDLGADVVTVPKDIKAWYGSHTTGTYAELGAVISLTNGEVPSQTLVIPRGCNLTMLNTRVHSGVKIVVENGGKLSLRQSTIEGILEVSKGGTLSVDYIDYGEGAGFTHGSVINGQIRMMNGSTLENARIVSHTNYSARDDINRNNSNPVVVTNGTVYVKGNVYIKGDEAADYGVGQKGLAVKGKLIVPDGSVIAVFGGGESQLSSMGGDAITLNNGTIYGDGKVIAVGGFGMNLTGNRDILGGGAAVSGRGTIDTDRAYLEGGYSFEKETQPINGNITLSYRTDRNLVTGKCIMGTGETTSPNYWHGTGDSDGICPDLSKYVVEDNAPIRRHSYRNTYWYPTYASSYYNWYSNYLFNNIMWYWFF
ncbi:hypothetical protein SAMN02910298_01613 [Pseudobutyrivibrio sp. YE44]|uniref:hypothetical protein n=1 Tax=Pseudobutyrivibrio sp. YE44 TaxID=1520802 RepID=UPI00088FCE86|nr:hypothetical protein [Pseudobutyrivibrio sp. YE44]SDB33328.1 hypothetical protein SAMN02910298_01613 [Pseudobutyrivibrio sp. YE44]